MPPPVPPGRDDSVTTRLEMTPEILASMLIDDSDLPTVRMPVRPPFATPEDEQSVAQQQTVNDEAVRKREVVGPDGRPRMVSEDELEEATRVAVPTKVLLSRARSSPKKTRP